MKMSRAQVPGLKRTDRPLTIQVERHEEAAVIRLGGSCTMEVSSQVRHAIVGLANEEIRLIVLDLSDLDFIDSNGLGGVIAGHLKLRHQRGSIRVVNPSPAITELLGVTKLTQIFPIFPDLASALAAPVEPKPPAR